MAKSRDTYNKKEKEKKRLKKKKDKEEKKEARKATSSKGDDLDSMMAYVDENGNLTSTPPDPTKKKKLIDHKDIEIGIARQEDAEPMEVLRKGTVTFFNESKGYGFIKDHETQESVFVHAKALVDQIQDKDKVTFEIENTPKGPNAIDVRLIK